MFTIFGIMPLIVLGTSIWVAVDASNLGVKRGDNPGFFDMSATGWFFACLFLWIIAFPAYIATRSRYTRYSHSGGAASLRLCGTCNKQVAPELSK